MVDSLIADSKYSHSRFLAFRDKLYAIALWLFYQVVMGQRFQSGAFVQQCFAVHPLCLSLKRIDERGDSIIACTSCRMMHHMAADQVVARVAAVPVDGDMSVPRRSRRRRNC
jgi:hypothetical protein